MIGEPSERALADDFLALDRALCTAQVLLSTLRARRDVRGELALALRDVADHLQETIYAMSEALRVRTGGAAPVCPGGDAVRRRRPSVSVRSATEATLEAGLWCRVCRHRLQPGASPPCGCRRSPADAPGVIRGTLQPGESVTVDLGLPPGDDAGRDLFSNG